MTFQADIQRQAYRADYTALGASLSPSLSGEERAPATERGSVHGFALQTVADPLAELSDSLEELTFQFEEGEMKDIGERELGETRQRRGASRITAIEQWRELLPDMPDSEVIARLLRRVRGAMAGGGGVSPEELLRCKRHLNELGINYLINVGPDGLGRIPGESQDILRRVAELENGR